MKNLDHFKCLLSSLVSKCLLTFLHGYFALGLRNFVHKNLIYKVETQAGSSKVISNDLRGDSECSLGVIMKDHLL